MLFEFWRIGQLLTNSTIRTDRKQIPITRILRRRGIEDLTDKRLIGVTAHGNIKGYLIVLNTTQRRRFQLSRVRVSEIIACRDVNCIRTAAQLNIAVRAGKYVCIGF